MSSCPSLARSWVNSTSHVFAAGDPRVAAEARRPAFLLHECADRGRLRHADHLERKEAFHGLDPLSELSRARREAAPGTGASAGPDQLAHQWRKCRRPVKTMAMWWRSATSIAISSRMEPPGWMIAVTPAWAAIWMPSGNGK